MIASVKVNANNLSPGIFTAGLIGEHIKEHRIVRIEAHLTDFESPQTICRVMRDAKPFEDEALEA